MRFAVMLALVQAMGGPAAEAPCPDCPPVQDPPAAADGEAVREQEEEPETELDLGGALRFNYNYKDWKRSDAAEPELGDFEFDTFRLNADGSYGDLLFSAEYRFYAGYHFLHHGWIGYQFQPDLVLQTAITQVPFGPLPYASHNYFFQLPYYLGLEDDYDTGAKLVYQPAPWDLQLAFFKNAEGPFTGNSIASARYSYDVVPALESELPAAGLAENRDNEERNQFNGRLAYGFDYGERGATEIGASGMWGQLHNRVTDEAGHHWAVSGHLDASLDRWDFKGEVIRFEKNPDVPPGVDERVVIMGAYDAPYKVAGRGNLYVAGLGYTIPWRVGPISSIQVYNDFSYLDKDEDDFQDTRQNVLGSLITAGPLFVYIDFASGRNHPWLGPNYGRALAEGSDDRWHTRFNVNLGYYF